MGGDEDDERELERVRERLRRLVGARQAQAGFTAVQAAEYRELTAREAELLREVTPEA
jgi:hypothetical protein